MSRTRKITAVVSSAALLGTAGIGVANAATSTDGSSSSTSSQTRPEGPRGGGHRLTTAQLQSIASKLGVSTAKLQAAIEANRPARPTGEQRGDRGAGRAADIAGALDADAAKVAEILEANRPARPADGTKLAAALASGLGLEQSAVESALDKLDAEHRAEREARDTARAAAIAKALGLETADVQAAFEAVEPAKPAR